MLTEKTIKNAKPKDSKAYKFADGHGLHLLITPNGSKLWRFRYRFDGKESMLGLGAYSPNDPQHVSLAKARERCFEARKLLSEGRNPAAERKQPHSSITKGAIEAAVTFESAATQWLASCKLSLTPKYGDVVERRVETWLIPSLGPCDIRKITGPELLRVIKRVH